ncbi:hypothetical protein [Pontibacter sp. SGAir0037]|uniref:hypothetical protein n=1 Tax=Pontibacter sp. SGAir0037 TaxID=2571030 RepID=UPI0010CD65C5|nr:hypothetical protein [Pontibacter sp. SGAir0037]QCR21208.1 hypothetical protein C1N53_01815 [Pontibacter sp. SGAir0037]
MIYTDFKETLSANKPPAEASVYLKALWYDGKGDWENAHELIQDLPDKNAAWIHAFLHRKEGDIWNADYWYRRADNSRPSVSLEDEWKQLVQAFL